MATERTFILKELDRSPYAEDGYFDERAQFNFVFPRNERYLCAERNAFVIGGAGVDGILYVLLPNDPAIYAHKYVDDEYVHISPDFDEFIQRLKRRDIVL